MRITLIILSAVALVIAVIFAILPLGTIALIPILIALLLALILKYKYSKGQKQLMPNIFLGVAILCGVIVISKSLFAEEKVVEDTQYEERIEESQEEAIEELEEIESELEELELEEDAEIEENLDTIN
ncbi:hypothetical protein HX109_12495 [Galbibacter sp. BG1]|uniref:hypothetical protein n=1 Tax=Galbibacter sp. BG1 TaxID=1170699 RepID=UPI0015B9E664|nr:hypothetical protein [Galbibacter sp. BG1]QLE02336.1 hypothetical protein HX109_12495 [Galbibacter sp. BG1]